jgi:hypothetical protein
MGRRVGTYKPEGEPQFNHHGGWRGLRSYVVFSFGRFGVLFFLFSFSFFTIEI